MHSRTDRWCHHKWSFHYFTISSSFLNHVHLSSLTIPLVVTIKLLIYTIIVNKSRATFSFHGHSLWSLCIRTTFVLSLPLAAYCLPTSSLLTAIFSHSGPLSKTFYLNCLYSHLHSVTVSIYMLHNRTYLFSAARLMRFWLTRLGQFEMGEEGWCRVHNMLFQKIGNEVLLNDLDTLLVSLKEAYDLTTKLTFYETTGAYVTLFRQEESLLVSSFSYSDVSMNDCVF